MPILTEEERRYFQELGQRKYDREQARLDRQYKEEAKANRAAMWGSLGAAAAEPATEAVMSWALGSGAAKGTGGALAGTAGAGATAGTVGTAGATAGTAGTAGAGMTGAGLTAGLTTLGIGAAAAASAAGQARGMHEGYKEYKEGHGKQMDGASKMLGSTYTPLIGFNEMLGNPIDDKTLTYARAAGGDPIAIAQVLGINFWGSKHKDQLGRDKWRREMEEKGFIDDKHQIELNGQKFEMGREKDELGNRLYNVNWEDAKQAEMANSIIPLARILANGDEKRTSDMTGHLTNAAMGTNSKATDVYNKFGFTDRNSAYNKIAEMQKANLLNQEQANAAFAEIDKTFNFKP